MGWPRASLAAHGLASDRLEALVQKVRAGDFGYVDRILVVHEGDVVLSRRFANDYVAISRGRDKRPHAYNYHHPDFHPYFKGGDLHTLQSVTKSIVSTLVAIAIRRGEIDGVDVRIEPFFDDYRTAKPDPRRSRIRLRDLLTMQAGIEWHETDVSYEDPRNTTARLEASDDWIQFTLDQPMAREPGTRFVYNSGASQLLARVLERSTGEPCDTYAEKHLFAPLGITDYHWKRTPKGIPDTEGGLYLRAEDLAKIGLLFLKGGVWDGARILPEGWVHDATARHVDDTTPDDPRSGHGYGYKWWRLDRAGTVVYAGLGFGGQYLLVIPELDVIGVVHSWNVFEPKPSMLRPFLTALIQTARSGLPRASRRTTEQRG